MRSCHKIILDKSYLPITERKKPSIISQLNIDQPQMVLFKISLHSKRILSARHFESNILIKNTATCLPETSPKHICFSAQSNIWILQKVVKLQLSAFLQSYFPDAAQTSCFHFYHSSNHTRTCTSSSAWNSTPNISGI